MVGGRGLRQQASGRSEHPHRLILGHLGLAAAGLALWVLYVSTDAGVLAWAAVVLLPVVAVLGLLMFVQWLGGASRAARRHPA